MPVPRQTILIPREGKLIRDKVPKRLKADRAIFRTRKLEPWELPRFAAFKIREEATELIKAHVEKNRSEMIVEAADVLEALYAFLKGARITFDQVEQARLNKARTHGRFNQRILLEMLESPEE